MRTTLEARRTRPAAVALIASLTLGAVGLAREARAGTWEGAPTGVKKTDPKNVAGLSDAMAAMVAGHAKFKANDFAGAIESYVAAIRLQPKNPLGHYFLGAAHLASGQAEDAEVDFRRANEAAGEKSPHKARVLFALADVLERLKKLEEAKAVWTRYIEHAAKIEGGRAFPESGKARLAAVEEALKQEKAYEVVRQRIASEKDGASKPR